MQPEYTTISVKGRAVRVPSACINGRRVIASRGWLSVVVVQDEDFFEGEVVQDPPAFVAQLKRAGLKADVFEFGQKPGDTEPKYGYHMEWDNAAVVPIKSFSDWWENRLPQVTRKNVRRSAKHGVTVRPVEFNDELVRGIVDIYNETPVRQGKPFWHYGKDFVVVKQEASSFLERSEFIGAYCGSELIGFIKLVYLGGIASILHIVAKNAHYDKRPTNALIAKAVEICEQRRLAFLVYGKYTYGNKTNCALREFKYRNGFEEIRFPRYQVPLTLKGRVAIGLRLHRGLKGMLPSGWIARLLKLRSGLLERFPLVSRLTGFSVVE